MENKSKELQTLEKIENLVRTSNDRFTEEDVLVLKRVIGIVSAVDAFGSFAGFIKSTIIWFGVIVGAIIAIRNGAIEFILNTVGPK